jgi:hypothetical protein
MYLQQDQADRLREIVLALVNGDQTWIESKGIDAKDKGECWIVNYNQFAGRNEYNRLVRGVVVRKPSGPLSEPLDLILSFPFMRFFNRGEAEASEERLRFFRNEPKEGDAPLPPGPDVDLTNSEMLEKMDGTMVGVFFPTGFPLRDEGRPFWHTRKMVSCCEADCKLRITSFHGGDYEFLPLIGKYVKAVKFLPSHTKYTFVFEFIHEATFVVTKYKPEQYGLYLLGARDMTDFHELTEQELDVLAGEMGVRRPRRWDAVKDDEQIMALMKSICAENPGFEGFVFRDKDTGSRIKLKDEDYVKIHHMIDSLSYKNLIAKVLEGEDEEILAYFPTAAPRIDRIREKFDQLVEASTDKIVEAGSKGLSRKELALTLFQQPVKTEKEGWLRGQIMRHFELGDRDKIRKEVVDSLRTLALGKGKNAGSPKTLIELIGLNDEDE